MGGQPENEDEEGGFGRPSLYRDTFPAQAAKLCALGATDDEIADFFEVSTRTIYRWKHDHDDFCQALKGGKEAADERVERSLYQRALGYTHEAVKMHNVDGEIVVTPYREHYPPDTTAAIFWLKNRRPADWREKQELEHSGGFTVVHVPAGKTALDA